MQWEKRAMALVVVAIDDAFMQRRHTNYEMR